MPKISEVRPVLLSCPYSHSSKSVEVQLYLKSGLRTTGLVEIKLDDGTTGLGEGYIAVFAPRVFVALIELIAPLLVGRQIRDFNRIICDVATQTGYWSLQGAAQHAVSAIEMALQDCRAKLLGKPVYEMLGAKGPSRLQLYGSGGNSISPAVMEEEFELLGRLGIRSFKIRARKDQTRKASWCLSEGARRGIRVAVDMTQNLAIPSQSVADVIGFCRAVEGMTEAKILFLEEVLGPASLRDLGMLRLKLETPVAGGEIVTTAQELCARVEQGFYDIIQPDATVIGGIQPVLEVFNTARRHGGEVVVHCWGASVGMMANYHAAVAAGATLAEWPLPEYPLRDALVSEPWSITGGALTLPSSPGLGVCLTPDIERAFPFREEAVYSCMCDRSQLPPDSTWC